MDSDAIVPPKSCGETVTVVTPSSCVRSLYSPAQLVCGLFRLRFPSSLAFCARWGKAAKRNSVNGALLQAALGADTGGCNKMSLEDTDDSSFCSHSNSLPRLGRAASRPSALSS